MRASAASVVVVSDCLETRSALRRILSPRGWGIREWRAVAEFRHHLKSDWRGVVLTESSLPDGTWQDILALTNAVCPSAQIVVLSRLADEPFWAEVLNRGAFDLLAQPLDETEVLRVGTSAWLHSKPKAAGVSA